MMAIDFLGDLQHAFGVARAWFSGLSWFEITVWISFAWFVVILPVYHALQRIYGFYVARKVPKAKVLYAETPFSFTTPFGLTVNGRIDEIRQFGWNTWSVYDTKTRSNCALTEDDVMEISIYAYYLEAIAQKKISKICAVRFVNPDTGAERYVYFNRLSFEVVEVLLARYFLVESGARPREKSASVPQCMGCPYVFDCYKVKIPATKVTNHCPDMLETTFKERDTVFSFTADDISSSAGINLFGNNSLNDFAINPASDLSMVAGNGGHDTVFSSTADDISSSVGIDLFGNNPSNDFEINPANGLPMVGGIDIEGNPCGTDFSHDHLGSSGINDSLSFSSTSSFDDTWSSGSSGGL